MCRVCMSVCVVYVRVYLCMSVVVYVRVYLCMSVCACCVCACVSVYVCCCVMCMCICVCLRVLVHYVLMNVQTSSFVLS